MAKTAGQGKKGASLKLKTQRNVRTIDQLTFARLIAQKFGFKISDVLSVIEMEQKLTMEYVKMGYRVIKKNYITIEGRRFEGKQNWISPLNGRVYNIPANTRILVRVGDGFKQFIGGKQMPERICRFVNGNGEPVANPIGA